MDDLISRRMAIDTLEAKKDKSAKGDIGCFYNTIIQNDIDALKGLPSAQSEQRWIPVIERLPVEGESVLLCNSYGDMTLGRLVRTNEGCNWDIYAWWCDIYDWVAWMPLPEPYKEGEENGND